MPPPPSPPSWEDRTQIKVPVKGALFSGFNQLWKIDAHLFAAWLEILERLQDATLWLPLFPDVAKPALQGIASRKELEERIAWTPLFGQDEHLLVKSIASLQLDTCVYNGKHECFANSGLV